MAVSFFQSSRMVNWYDIVFLCAGIHGDGGGGVAETDVAGADSHPSNVAVRVAAKAAFDVFEAVWPKHATTWVEEGMEPRWRRLVTHGEFIFCSLTVCPYELCVLQDL